MNSSTLMKRLLLILLIPTLSYSQTYDDIISINSPENFKKVVIENDYQLDYEDESLIKYNYVGNKRDGIIRTSVYSVKDNSWEFSFKRPDYDWETTPYDLIVSEIKDECKYYKIISVNNVDFVSYSCHESTYNGNLGFVITNDSGIIKMFPKRQE